MKRSGGGVSREDSRSESREHLVSDPRPAPHRPRPATHLPWLLSKGPCGSPSHQENASVLPPQLDAEGGWVVRNRLGTRSSHSSRQSRVTFSDVESPRLPRSVARPVPAAGRKSSHLLPPGDVPSAATRGSSCGPPTSSGTCSRTSLVRRAAQLRRSLLLCSQPSWRSENCCWALLTNQVQCETNARKKYCSPGLSLRVHDTAVRSHSPDPTGAWTTCPHPRTHPSSCCTCGAMA